MARYTSAATCSRVRADDVDGDCADGEFCGLEALAFPSREAKVTAMAIKRVLRGMLGLPEAVAIDTTP
jgi:hypothetical protein